ncbi:hypothetical protein P8918_13635 [Bacillus spizizenii]|nr:hypothetical protein [Bacillus spizizenii]MCY8890346.1 hypothetical protein [Bacillus spizizenii]MEC0842070.1 hypothetical protein [Bacillus spizizenii]
MIPLAARGLTQAIRKTAKNADLSSIKNLTTGQKLNAAGTAAAGVMGYNDARDEGYGVVGSMAKGATDAFLIDLIGWKKYLVGGALMSAPKMMAQGYESLNRQARALEMSGRNIPFQNNTFVDNEQIYTMRQAGMNMIGQSSMNVKTAVLGNEAQFMHR